MPSAPPRLVPAGTPRTTQYRHFNPGPNCTPPPQGFEQGTVPGDVHHQPPRLSIVVSIKPLFLALSLFTFDRSVNRYDTFQIPDQSRDY
jgi:hypothetical protein